MSEKKLNIPQDIAELPFEKALEELETAVDKIEREVLPLEEQLAVFERGSYLAIHCRQKLTALEKRIEILKSSNQENADWQEFNA